MNNSDYNDFKNWQNDGDDENNPHNPHGFFYYGPVNDKFKKMWNQINNNEDYIESMKDYLNIDDILKEVMNPMNKMPKPNKRNEKPKTTTVNFTQDEYMKLIEIRGYLAITEQHAHVKALDKVLSQITMLPPNDPRRAK
jgi:NDP-sugar pyrophosphorylase family protein